MRQRWCGILRIINVLKDDRGDKVGVGDVLSRRLLQVKFAISVGRKRWNVLLLYTPRKKPPEARNSQGTDTVSRPAVLGLKTHPVGRAKGFIEQASTIYKAEPAV